MDIERTDLYKKSTQTMLAKLYHIINNYKHHIGNLLCQSIIYGGDYF